jgi:2-methylisocitrate lyase-like PEP mutase family enzyme
MADTPPGTLVRRTLGFRALHERGDGFVMPNAWDAGSAIVLARQGFASIATTSAGIAFSLGCPDHRIPEGGRRVSRTQMFDRIREITDAVEVPVNGDLEDGYGARPEAVADTIRLAIQVGLAGGNIEDHADGSLYDIEDAAERIAAAHESAAQLGTGFVLTARTDGLLLDPDASLDDAIRRANRYREAGADCLYVPGVNDLARIATLVREIDGPLNVVMGLGGGGLTVDALREIGVARLSLGGTIARAALGFVRDSARELRTRGTLEFAAAQFSQSELNSIFSERTRPG